MKTYRWKTVLALAFMVVLTHSTLLHAFNPYLNVEEMVLPGDEGFGYGYGLLPLFEYPMTNGDLYVGSPNVGEGVQIWKKDDSTDEGWKRVADTGLNGNPENFAIINYFEFNSHSYLSVWSKSWDGRKDDDPDTDTWGLLFRVESMDPFVIHRVDPPDGFGGVCVMGKTVHRHTDPRDGQEKEFLYVGITTGRTGVGGKVYRIAKGEENVPIDPQAWELVETSFDKDVTDVSVLCIYNGEIYAGLENNTDGGRVWKYADNTHWVPVSEYGFGTIGEAGPKDKNKNAFWLFEYQGQLYSQTWNGAGSELLRYEGGEDWTLLKKYVDGDGGGLGVFNGKMMTFGSNDEVYYYYPEEDRFEEVILPPCLSGIASIKEHKGRLYISTSDFYQKPFQSALVIGGFIEGPAHGGIWEGELSTIDLASMGGEMPPCCGAMPGLRTRQVPVSYMLALLFPLVCLHMVKRTVNRRTRPASRKHQPSATSAS